MFVVTSFAQEVKDSLLNKAKEKAKEKLTIIDHKRGNTFIKDKIEKKDTWRIEPVITTNW